MVIGFRVDANEQIAMGHLMRCLSIAEMCRKKGQECVFYLAEERETGRLEQKGFPYHILHTSWKEMEAETEVLKTLFKAQKPDWLVVDSYQATENYLRELNREIPVLYLDDMENAVFPVSAVLHYGIDADRESYRRKYEENGTDVLMGLDYVPLREEFSGKKNRTKDREKSILVTTGGTDPFRIADKLLHACLRESKAGEHSIFEGFSFEVIVGALNDHVPSLQALAREYPNVQLHQNVSNMSEYMEKCMMAVSAGGTTIYELCACGIPTVCFSFADNQQAGTIAFEKKGLMDYAGDARETDVVENILHALEQLCMDDEKYRLRQKKMQEAVDGKGAERIADFFLGRKE